MALSKVFHPFTVIEELKRTIASIHWQWRGTRRENERLREELGQVRERAQYLERERERLREENEQLKRQLEDAQRATKRQAAPFSRPHPGRASAAAGAQAGCRLWHASSQTHSRPRG